MTGVQTCALQISASIVRAPLRSHLPFHKSKPLRRKTSTQSRFRESCHSQFDVLERLDDKDIETSSIKKACERRHPNGLVHTPFFCFISANSDIVKRRHCRSTKRPLASNSGRSPHDGVLTHELLASRRHHAKQPSSNHMGEMPHLMS